MAAGGLNSGTCVPQAYDAPGTPTIGVCIQGGEVALGHPCDTISALVRSGPLCEAGLFCTEFSGCVPLGPGGCEVPDGGVTVSTHGDHDRCDYSTQCACPFNCVFQPAEPNALCEAPCDDGGGCPQPRVCRNGFCD